MNPFTIADAHEMGAPECFAYEYAERERHGTLPPYSGPVYPDYGSDAAYLYDDHDEMPVGPPWSGDEEPPAPCQGPPTFAFLGMPPAYRHHEAWCWERAHDDDCPPPF
jgi:hypothetical protein